MEEKSLYLGRPKFCIVCGKNLEPTSKFCIKCGREVGKTESENKAGGEPAKSESQSELQQNKIGEDAPDRMGQLVQNFSSIFGGFGIVYFFVAIVANDFPWAMAHILDIGIATFFSALFVTGFTLFDKK